MESSNVDIKLISGAAMSLALLMYASLEDFMNDRSLQSVKTFVASTEDLATYSTWYQYIR